MLPEYILTSVTLLVALNPVKEMVIESPYAPVEGFRIIFGEIIKVAEAVLPPVSEALTVWLPLALEGAVIVVLSVPVAEAIIFTAGVRAALSHKIDTGAFGVKPVPAIAI